MFPEVDDVCLGFFLGLLVAGVGLWVTEGKDALRRLGVVLAAGVFLGLCAWKASERKPETVEEFWPVVLSSLILSWIALGFLWVGLGIVGSIYAVTFGALFSGFKKWNHQRYIDYLNYRERQKVMEGEWRLKKQQEEDRAQREAAAKLWAAGEEQRRQEQIAKIQKRYDQKLQMMEAEKAAGRMDDIEFRSGCDEAKRVYLKEMAEAMK